MNAHDKGVPYEDCPYEWDEHECDAWEDGWTEARDIASDLEEIMDSPEMDAPWWYQY